MSIIIKGMDMPKDLTAMTVIMHGLNFDYSQTVYRDKIVEIPTPHGRLIDELKRHRDEYANDHGWNTSVLESLDVAITILEAEE